MFGSADDVLPNTPPALPNQFEPLPNQIEPITDDEIEALSDLPNELPNAKNKLRNWRRETIKKNGVPRYWIWRRGTEAQRESYKGGLFEDLTDEQKQQYQINVERRANGKRKREGRSKNTEPEGRA